MDLLKKISRPGARRLKSAEVAELLKNAGTADLMFAADILRRRRHGNRTYFTHSLNLNPSNICENRCELCAFWREPDAADAYLLSLPQARERLLAARNLGLTDLHIVGGVNPQLDLAYYEELLGLARELLPGVLVQGLTAVEIHHLAANARLSVREVLQRLKAAGLGAIPGGGAEIFNASLRKVICSRKISAAEWLAVHAEAHSLGLPTNATMLFGHLETADYIAAHLDELRRLQDKTGGFGAFIALPFHAAGTRLNVERGPGGHTIARVVALARIFLDNFPHIRVLANYMDHKLLQVLTAAGADDVGGTSLDERIARAAGAPETQRITTVAKMTAFLRGLKLEPVLVNSTYQERAGEDIAKIKRGEGEAGFPSPLEGEGRRERSERGVRGGFQGKFTPHPALATLVSALSHKGRGNPPNCLPALPMLSTSIMGSKGAKALSRALAHAAAGKRLREKEAVLLLEQASMQQLGILAQQRRMAAVPERTATFVIDRNISITNVCEAGCKFCAFHVGPGSAQAFTLTIDQIVEKVLEAVKLGATQVMLQGGLNPALDLRFYEEMLAAIRQRAEVCLHSLSPAEVLYLARRSNLTVSKTLARLRAAGLSSLPGGGAEILVEEVRARVSPRKISAAEWFEVMRCAHTLGLNTTATMVYGLGESVAQRVEHLLRIRELQDQTGRFTAFIPWSFMPNRTQLALEPQSGVEYLRMVALARLVLDNVAHLQAGWVTEGPDLAQLALSFGADDWGGVLMEERVVRATGVSYTATVPQVRSWIIETGLTPTQRTTDYKKI
jgi:cyclic dehypoxanthinyl futalosine synthase